MLYFGVCYVEKHVCSTGYDLLIWMIINDEASRCCKCTYFDHPLYFIFSCKYANVHIINLLYLLHIITPSKMCCICVSVYCHIYPISVSMLYNSSATLSENITKCTFYKCNTTSWTRITSLKHIPRTSMCHLKP